MGSVVGEKFARAGRPRARGLDAADLGRRLRRRAHAGERPRAHADGQDHARASTRCNEAGIPFVSVLSHPTTGGVMASFAALGDVIIAEPGALMSFAGPRVVQQTTRETAARGLRPRRVELPLRPHRHDRRRATSCGACSRACCACSRAASSSYAVAEPRPSREPRILGRVLRPVRRLPHGAADDERGALVVRGVRSELRGLRRRIAERARRVGHLGCGRARAPRRAAVHARLRRAAARRLHRAARRPRRRRGSGDRGRARALPRAHDRARRPPEGPRPQAARVPQLRQRAARGLRQGDPRLRAREPPRLPGAHASSTRRAPTRASTSEQRGQAGAIARSMLAMVRLARAVGRRRDRRGRLGRRARDRRRRPRADDGELDLLGDLARGRRRDPLEATPTSAARPPRRSSRPRASASSSA